MHFRVCVVYVKSLHALLTYVLLTVPSSALYPVFPFFGERGDFDSDQIKKFSFFLEFSVILIVTIKNLLPLLISKIGQSDETT
jgi:hypothetical protein